MYKNYCSFSFFRGDMTGILVNVTKFVPCLFLLFKEYNAKIICFFFSLYNMLIFSQHPATSPS